MHGLATRSTNIQMTNCPLSGRVQGHVTHSRILHPLKYISGKAEANVVKFCVLAGYN